MLEGDISTEIFSLGLANRDISGGTGSFQDIFSPIPSPASAQHIGLDSHIKINIFVLNLLLFGSSSFTMTFIHNPEVGQRTHLLVGTQRTQFSFTNRRSTERARSYETEMR